jgi:hypothetical protein
MPPCSFLRKRHRVKVVKLLGGLPNIPIAVLAISPLFTHTPRASRASFVYLCRFWHAHSTLVCPLYIILLSYPGLAARSTLAQGQDCARANIGLMGRQVKRDSSFHIDRRFLCILFSEKFIIKYMCECIYMHTHIYTHILAFSLIKYFNQAYLV